MSLRDLDALLELDTDRDQRVSSAELAQSSALLSSYLLDRLELHADGAACSLEAGASSAVGEYLHFDFRARCPNAPQQIVLRYDLFFDHDPSHTSQVVISSAEQQPAAAVLRADARELELRLGTTEFWRETRAYLQQGVWHIWTGYDHILFLCTLLLPAALRGTRLRSALGEVLKIVTAFTLAHSLTLSVAALQAVELPTRWVEATIAASVCWAALNNVYNWVTRRIWLVVFAFGLVHGFGFASVLHELGLPSSHLIAALVAFNAGVELGQLAIVATLFPLAFALRGMRWYAPLVLSGGSLVIAAIGGGWLIERALDLPLARALDLAYAASTGRDHKDELQEVLRAERSAREQGRWNEAARHLERAKQLTDSPTAQAEIWRRMGSLHVVRANLAEAHAAFERALALSAEANDLRGVADTERQLGVVARLSGERALAMRRYRHAFAAHERLGLAAYAASDAADLAALYIDAKLYNDAEAMYTRALTLSEAQRDEQQMARLSAELGALHQRRAASDAAATWFERAARFHESAARPVDAANQYANLALVRREQGKLDEASALYARSLALFRQHGQLARASRVQHLLDELVMAR